MTHPGSTAMFEHLYATRATVVDQNYDYHQAFYRALKVVHISYPEYNTDISPASYQNINLFIQEMQELYGQQFDGTHLDQGLHIMRTEEEIGVCLSVKKFKGLDTIIKPRIEVTIPPNFFFSYDIDPNEKIQQMTPIKPKFFVLQALRNDPTQQLVFSIKGDNLEDHPLNEFRIPFSRTHPEGYEEWFDFGRGVELLINMEYRVENEPNITPEQVSNFHLHTIYKMLERRILLQTGSTGLGHSLRKADVTHRRPLVDPEKNEMFWSSPLSGTKGPLKKRSTNVKFIDFQTGWNSNEDFEDNICLCSEWCNWNAFFYYNPIYRFLLVRHNQLYMKERERTTLPNMYLNVSIICGCGPPPQKAPILHLLNNANDYKFKYYENYYLKDPDFKHYYRFSAPNGARMDAISYLRLKNELNIIKLCHELDDNPFADICNEGLLIYYKVLIDLHKNISVTTNYVGIRSVWFKSIDSIGRNQCTKYFKESYLKLMRVIDPQIGYDWLFSTDYEYSSRFAKREDEIEIRSIRANVLKRSSLESPFNFQIVLNNFLNTFVSIYKFLSSVEPRLPTMHTIKTMAEISDSYIKFDKEFEAYHQSNKTFQYQIESIVLQFPTLEQNFNAFYSLKLYFYLFEIQKHCINLLLKTNKKRKTYSDQVCEQFSFIFRNSKVEQNYLSVHPGQPLFEISSHFERSFDEFYDYWGRPDHEINQNLSIDQFVDSRLKQFARLYYWWSNNGNGKNKFKKIVDQFIECQNNSVNCSETVIENQIMPSLLVLIYSYEYSIEVFDQLVYYAVKANCSVILSTTSKLLKKMHSLQIPNLVTNKVSYSFCKPGWVPLFLTMHSVLNTIDRLNRNYIAFDDEFERISNTCLQTKEMVKNIYRQFYNKLSNEWIDEMRTTHYNSLIAPGQTKFKLFSMYLAVGQAFIGVFVDDFRLSFKIYRKNCLRFLNTIANPSIVGVFQTYFTDRNTMRNAMPFHSYPWRDFLGSDMTQLDRLPPHLFHVDLKAADI